MKDVRRDVPNFPTVIPSLLNVDTDVYYATRRLEDSATIYEVENSSKVSDHDVYHVRNV